LPLKECCVKVVISHSKFCQKRKNLRFFHEVIDYSPQFMRVSSKRGCKFGVVPSNGVNSDDFSVFFAIKKLINRVFTACNVIIDSILVGLFYIPN
jgi:hypothetical protein